MENSKYYYGAARVRSLEARLVSPEQLERMAAAPDFSSTFSVLSETTYSENLPKLKDPFNFDELFELEQADLKKLLQGLAPENECLAALFKGRDLAILKQQALSCSSPLIIEMINSKIDLTNLMIILRNQIQKKEKNEIARALLEPGLLDHDLLLSLLDKTPQDISAKLSFTPYFPALAEGFKHLAEHGTFHVLEKNIGDYIINKFRTAKYVNSGIEPLVGYYLAKENEMDNLRFILVCSKNELEPEKIKARLKVNYA